MTTIFSRGRPPMMEQSSSTVTTLCRYLVESSFIVALSKVVKPGLGRLGNRQRIPERSVLPHLDLGHHASHALVERNEGAPPKLLRDQRDVGPSRIGLARALGNIGYRAADEFNETVDCLRISSAEIPDAGRVLGFSGEQEGRSDVACVNEIALLCTVADNGEWRAGELLSQEDAKDCTVGAGRSNPRAIGIEDANRVDRQAVDPVPVKRCLFAHQLRESVRVLRVELMVLAGRHLSQAVARRRRRIDEL